MRCKNCLVKLPEDSLFCTKCGHILLSKEDDNLEAKEDYNHCMVKEISL